MFKIKAGEFINLQKIFFSFFSSFFLSAAYAQQLETLLFKKIEGLSQSTGYSITKDKQGFLWIATGNGLNRYDGIEMKIYKPSLETGKGQMRGRVIRSRLLEDDEGQLWFSTDLSVHEFNKQSETFSQQNLITANKKNASETFANPVIKLGDHLWLANATDGLFDLNTKTKKIIFYPLTEKDEKGNLVQLMYHGIYDGNAKLWFATNKGLLSFDLTTKKWKRFFEGRSFYSICYSKDTIYASEGKQLIWLHKTTFQYGKNAFVDNADFLKGLIHCLYADGRQNIWMGDENGNVYCKETGNAVFRWVGNINGNIKPKSHYPVYCFYADSSNTLWVGAYTLGLLKAQLDQPQFRSYPREGSNVNEIFVNSIYESNQDEVLIGSFENGIIVLNKRNNTATELKLPYEKPELAYSKSVPLIQEDSHGNIWTSKSGYLFVKEKESKNFIPLKIPILSNALQVPQMWSLAEYKNTLLIGTTIGLYQVWKNNGSYQIKYLLHFGQDRVSNIWIAPSSEIWVAYESGGIVVYRSIEQPMKVRHLFPGTNVRAISFDKEHALNWIASSSGLIAYHSHSGLYKNFTENDGLLNSYVYGVLQDKDQLWLSTSYGLSKASVVFQNNSLLPVLQFTNFTTGDGLPDNVFNARAFHKGASGTFYFGSTKAVTWFKPVEITSRQNIPSIRVIDLLVNDKRPDRMLAPEYVDKLFLAHKQNNLFFRFRGIDFNNPQRITYAYRLEGWDKDWVYSKQLNEVRYSNLPHGKYAFKIKAANGAGIWNEHPYTIDITIQPPFWRTWWFYVFAGIAVLYAAIAVTKALSQRKLRKQLRELEKQAAIEAERYRISRDMHDEIGSGLTQIALMSELIETQKKADEELKKDVGTISFSARKLVGNMSEIIWALNPQNDTLENLLAYLREQTLTNFEPFDVHYSVQFPDEVPFIRLSNEQRRNLFLVAKEALNNALKHSGATEISLRMEFSNNTIHFFVSDNGKGFTTGDIKIASSGLRNMQRRMYDIDGRFDLDSTGRGCFIHFSFPVSNSNKKGTTTFFTSFKKQS